MRPAEMIDLEVLSDSIARLEKEKVLGLVTHALRMGVSAQKIIDAAITGMDKVGLFYKSGEYCISDLIVSGIIFDSILEIDSIKENLGNKKGEEKPSLVGTIVAGTVEDDIHSIGKTIFRSMAMSVGFRVIDLGVDVHAETFLKAAHEYRPDVIAMSALLTSVENNIRRISARLKNDPETSDIYLLLGGACASLGPSGFPHVDGFSVSAKQSVDLCIDSLRRIAG